MSDPTNEELCALAQAGDAAAMDALATRNLGLVYRAAQDIWKTQRELNRKLGLQFAELVQEGCLGLLRAAIAFDPEHGSAFASYAVPAIRNAMLDMIRSVSSDFESKAAFADPALYLVSLNDPIGEEGKTERGELVSELYYKSPEQLYIEKESREELWKALSKISKRDYAYLDYRFGLTRDEGHPRTETAEHFHLTESRAKKTEERALEHLSMKLPW